MNDWISRAASEFASNGYGFLQGFLPSTDVLRLRAVCDRVLALWVAERGGTSALKGSTNMACLTDLRYHEDIEGKEELLALLELYADERILDLLRRVSGTEPRFRNDQYFFEPPVESFDGVWHRDTQFDAVDDDDEKRRMGAATGVHFRIALAPDPWLEYVPGSEKRWDTPEELAIRKGPDSRTGAMPGRTTLALEPGDALLFHAWGIHRGRYVAGRERRTLDIIYEWGDTSIFGEPPEIGSGDDDLVRRSSIRARALFREGSSPRSWRARR